jgi:hypothetical protein
LRYIVRYIVEQSFSVADLLLLVLMSMLRECHLQLVHSFSNLCGTCSF